MRNAGPAGHINGEDPVLVGIQRLDQAVGGHHDGAREGGEFILLVLPGGTVVAAEVGVFVQFRITVGGQHLAVTVHVDASAFGRLEDLGENLQIMPGNHDGLARLDAGGNLNRCRIAKGFGIGFVQALHGAQVGFTATADEIEQRFQMQAVIQGGHEAFTDEVVHVAIFETQGAGVMGIGRSAFEAVDEQLLEGFRVGIQIRIGSDAAQFFSLLDHFGKGCGRFEVGSRQTEDVPAAGVGYLLFELLSQGYTFVDQLYKALRVEVDVGQRAEECLGHETADLDVVAAVAGSLRGHHRQPAQGVDQQILHGCGIRLLAADSRLGAATAFGGLFTLVTKHDFLLGWWLKCLVAQKYFFSLTYAGFIRYDDWARCFVLKADIHMIVVNIYVNKRCAVRDFAQGAFGNRSFAQEVLQPLPVLGAGEGAVIGVFGIALPEFMKVGPFLTDDGCYAGKVVAADQRPSLAVEFVQFGDSGAVGTQIPIGQRGTYKKSCQHKSKYYDVFEHGAKILS